MPKRSRFEKKVKKRRTKGQIKELVLSELEVADCSTGELYRRLGYAGNVSKTIRTCIAELIAEGMIHFTAENLQDANNALTISN